MRALVVGYGSIGERHARILNKLLVETAVVSSRAIDFPVTFQTLEQAVAEFQPHYIVIANKTSDHYTSLSILARLKWQGKVLVEKPLFHKNKAWDEKLGLQVYVAYNLRFHPILQRLKTLLAQEKILSVAAYAGQYLPDWRPQRDYRLSYSSNKEEGGGVLRDLSHELDYLIWLFGTWSRLTGLGGHYSTLATTGDDICGVMMETQKTPLVTLQLNYMDRPGRREIVVVTDRHTYKADLTKASLETDGQVEHFQVERDLTYLAQHMAILNDTVEHVCSYSEGLQTVQMINRIEQAIVSKEWVYNE
ncbi:hypothetical protein BBD42_11225 [Paenibacillus sp. BIHB 4019]|uniref:GFO/IDH/MocA-like oxidoreductase domain-containing protein n=1 Tax=Paenibacillus sp. BIHB 4019 TaxID=1870819 RepID=A0A1B2DGY8_9BACL|nr:Gfo/Idh/MocA family oxidoreductase [Paenibacillus sp. BIHB 4019]ANY66978.1 hypothetical protein BBD42_11225 [Paenibacillus sp. BIHB 4019]